MELVDGRMQLSPASQMALWDAAKRIPADAAAGQAEQILALTIKVAYRAGEAAGEVVDVLLVLAAQLWGSYEAVEQALQGHASRSRAAAALIGQAPSALPPAAAEPRAGMSWLQARLGNIAKDD